MSLVRIQPEVSAARDAVRSAIGQAAQKTGVDFSYLVAQAQSESGLNPAARAAGSSATGLFQFLDQTWLGVVKQHGAEQGLSWAADAIQARPGGGFSVAPAARDAVFALREQAGPAALMAACYASDNAQGLSRALGREVNGTDLYFAHFLGLDGARRFLQAAGTNPDAGAAALFPREARANRSIFYQADGSARSLADVYALMGRKLDRAGSTGGGGQTDLATNGTAASDLAPTDLALGQATGGDGGLALAMAKLAAAAPDGAANSPDGTAPAGVGSLLAQLDQGRINLLRPNPAQARLAYLMLAMPDA